MGLEHVASLLLFKIRKPKANFIMGEIEYIFIFFELHSKRAIKPVSSLIQWRAIAYIALSKPDVAM